MKKFEIIPKNKKDQVKMKPVSTRLPVPEHEKLERLAKNNGLNTLELAQQMLLHCLGEVDKKGGNNDN